MLLLEEKSPHELQVGLLQTVSASLFPPRLPLPDFERIILSELEFENGKVQNQGKLDRETSNKYKLIPPC